MEIKCGCSHGCLSLPKTCGVFLETYGVFLGTLILLSIKRVDGQQGRLTCQPLDGRQRMRLPIIDSCTQRLSYFCRRRLSLLDHSRQFLNRVMLENLLNGDMKPQILQTRCHPETDQRIAAQIEEIVVNPDGRDTQHFSPNGD